MAARRFASANNKHGKMACSTFQSTRAASLTVLELTGYRSTCMYKSYSSLCDWVGCRAVVAARNRYRWPCSAVFAYLNEKKAAMLSLCISDRISTRCSVSFRSIDRSVGLIEDVYKRCNWNRKRSELEMHRHCGDHHLAICMSTSINLIYKDAVGTSPQRLFDAVRWSLSTRQTLA